MARLPDTYNRRPTPSYGRTRTPAPVVPVDKGAGLSALGAGITDFAGSMAKIQSRDDRFAAIGAATKLEAWMIEDRDGENGWSKTKAGNVKDDFVPSANTRFNSTVSELSGGLANDAQREDFARRAALASNRNKSNLFAHVTSEKKVEHDNTYKAAVLMAQESGATNWNNSSEVLIGLESLRDATALYADENGIVKEDEVALLQKQAASSVHARVIGEAVDAKDPKYAAAWLEINRKNMVDDDIDAAEKLIENGSRTEISQEVVDGYFDDPDMTKKEMDASTRKNHDGKERDDILARTAARWGEEKSGEIEGYRVASEEAYDIYNNGIDNLNMTAQEAFDSIPSTVRERMSQKALSAMRREASIRSQSQSVYTIYSAWDEIMSLTPDEFRAVNLNEYANRISTTDLKTLRKAQLDPAQYGLLLTDASILKEVVVGVLGTDTKGKIQGTPEDQIAIQTEFNKRIQEAAEEKGKALTKPEKDKLAKTLLIDITKKNRFFLFGDDRGPSTFTGRDDIVKAMDLTIPGVPKREIIKYVRELEAQKIPGEELEIEDWQILELYYTDNPDQRPGSKSKTQKYPVPAVQSQLLKNQEEYRKRSGE